MRPPVTTATINDGAPSLRKLQTSTYPKEVLAENRKYQRLTPTTASFVLGSESDNNYLCYSSKGENFNSVKRSDSIYCGQNDASTSEECFNLENDHLDYRKKCNNSAVNSARSENCYKKYDVNRRNSCVSTNGRPFQNIHSSDLNETTSLYFTNNCERSNFENSAYKPNESSSSSSSSSYVKVSGTRSENSEVTPLLIHDQSNSLTLIKNSASLIFTKKDPSPIVHRRRDNGKFITPTALTSATTAREEHRRSLPISGNGDFDRKQQSYSWYAPVYSTLTEEIEQDSRESSPYHNLACTKKQHTNGSRESASLLESIQPNQPQLHQPRTRKQNTIRPPSTLNIQPEGPHATIPLGGPTAPKCSRFEQLIKSIMGRNKVSREPLTPPLLQSPEIKITKSPSEHTLIRNDKITASTTSLNNTVQQKIWSVVPLLRRDDSCASLHQTKSSSSPLAHYSGLKKCETVLALSKSSSNLEPIKPQNRLRNSSSTCSGCSSLLSLVANGSRYSLNLSSGGFVAVGSGDELKLSNKTPTPPPIVTYMCKLCLGDVTTDNLTKIAQCGCLFCTECMVAYVEFEILEGAYEISCPDALCPAQGILALDEIIKLTSNSLVDKHNRYRLNREVELDKSRTWCPRAGCETVCSIGQSGATAAASEKAITIQPQIVLLSTVSVKCPTCLEEFCSGCKKPWHPTMSCEENTRRLAADGQDDSIGIPFDNDLIKCCPMCSVPIEKDEGCAQMMCKRCKHVFCWYCLASLDDDFLLRHYDKGPCKNKLGHSRASVVWHRAQVIGIFAGFGILLLVASPLLLLAAPCIVCCKCRLCNGASKIDENEAEFDEATVTLQR